MVKHYGIWCAAFLSLAIAPQALCQSERSGPEYAADQSQTDRADPPGFWSTFADDLKSGGKGPLMVGIDPGNFRMGCVSGFRCGDNVPVRDIAITRPFGMSVYEVTVAEFRRFVEATGYVTDAEHAARRWPVGKQLDPLAAISILRTKRHCMGFSAEHLRANSRGIHVRDMTVRLRTWRQPGFERRDDHPVVCISWSDAKEYVSWLAAETGKPYRLLGEAEWEYAARAEPLAHDDYDNASAWCDPKKDREQFCKTRTHHKLCLPQREPTLVGSYGPNAFGLYDIGTNASEWTEDCWSRRLPGLPSDGSARTSGDCSKRVLRDFAFMLLSPPHESRAGVTIHESMNWYGLRVAMTPDWTY